MFKRNDFYESLGSYFIDSDNDYIESNINSKLFNEIKVKVTIIGINQPSNDVSIVYKIKGIEIEKGEEYKNKLAQPLQKTLNNMNDYLAFEGKNKGYKGDWNNWTIFYLLKEFITACQAGGYKYFRGQAHSWPIVPSIFRKKKDLLKGRYTYEEFENTYKNISREFPGRISYFPLSEDNLEKRTDELAILQHYGFPTPLVDITSNPFIAMMFMVCFGEIEEPEFQCFKINSEDSQGNTIVSFVDKLGNNRRIKAQKGAFLNYDKLSYL